MRVSYTRFYGPHNLCGTRTRASEGSETGVRGVRQGAREARCMLY